MKTELETLDVIMYHNNPCLKFSSAGKSPSLFLQWYGENKPMLTDMEIIEYGFDKDETFFIAKISSVSDQTELLLADAHNYLLSNLK